MMITRGFKVALMTLLVVIPHAALGGLNTADTRTKVRADDVNTLDANSVPTQSVLDEHNPAPAITPSDLLRHKPMPPTLSTRHQQIVRRFSMLPASAEATVASVLAAFRANPSAATDSTRQSMAMLAYHVSEYERIDAEMARIQAEIDAMQSHLDTIDAEIAAQWEVYDNQFESVMQSSIPSPRNGRERSLWCMGWKQTQNCKWSSTHDTSGDKSCFSPVFSNHDVGYCAVRDDDTDEYFRVMRSDCLALPPGVAMSCRFAPAFANFAAVIEQVLAEPATTYELAADAVHTNSDQRVDGIVSVVSPSTLMQAKTLVLSLRTLGCRLPVELWYYEDAMQKSGDELKALLSSLEAVAPAASVVLKPMDHEMMEDTETAYAGRIRAIRGSSFTHVLCLDIATLPLRDPTYLFTLHEFEATGALFWPDVFHAATTQSNLQPTSLLWEYIDMAFVDMFEQDDRQLLIRRDRHTLRALRLVELFAPHRPNLFRRLELTAYGKDDFRLAWLKSATKFHMVQIPPSLGGSTAPAQPERFCGSHVVQHDTMGRMLFLHRQQDAGLGPVGELKFLQAFDWRLDTTNAQSTERISDAKMLLHYNVRPFNQDESARTKCYAFSPDADSDGRVTTRLWVDTQANVA